MKNILGKLNFIDIVIVAGVMVAISVGLFTMKHFRQTADKQIEAVSTVTFQIFLRGVTYTGEELPVKNNEKTFITIRNVPYTELNVTDVVSNPRQTAISSSKAVEQYILIKDPTQPSLYDAIVTVEDIAKITKDGAVVGGNKINMGLPVTIEGENYKFNGTISDVRVTNETKIEDAGENKEIG